MRTIAITSLMLVLIAGLSGAQGMFQPPKPEADSFQAYTPITGKGLFDPSRFSMSNSYSMSFISNGHQSIYQNLYVNSSRYQILQEPVFESGLRLQLLPARPVEHEERDLSAQCGAELQAQRPFPDPDELSHNRPVLLRVRLSTLPLVSLTDKFPKPLP